MKSHLLHFDRPHPGDILDRVFNQAVLDKWARYSEPELIRRLEILRAPNHLVGNNRRQQICSAWKAAYREFISSADSCGLLDNDIEQRLRDHRSNNFRGAMAQCKTCWLFSRNPRIHVGPGSKGRKEKQLDLSLNHAGLDIGVEVKSSFESTPETTWGGDESKRIRRAVDAADKQFDDKTPNLLVFVPRLRVDLFESRTDVLHAVFGGMQYVVPLPHSENSTSPRFEFNPSGKFLKRHFNYGEIGKVSCQRISAMLVLEIELDIYPEWPHLCEPIESALIKPKAFVVPNPLCHFPIADEFWGDIPRFINDDSGYGWTDRSEQFTW